MDNEAKEKATGIWTSFKEKGMTICLVLAVILAVPLQSTCGKCEGGSGGGRGKKFEVNAPVKSLCGFSIGATPNNVYSSLFKNRKEAEEYGRGDLATKFRYFDHARVDFSENPITGEGRYLTRVMLSVEDDSALRNWEEKDYTEECEIIVAMLEKKYGIKFKKGKHPDYSVYAWRWSTGPRDDCVSQSITLYRMPVTGTFTLDFCSELYSAQAEKALKEKQRKASKLSAGAGSDQL